MDIIRGMKYCPQTGLMYKGDCIAGKKRAAHLKRGVMDNLDQDGYRVLSVGKRLYKQHRLAFLLMGQDIPNMIDHINGDRKDNRWDNLRASSPWANQQNRKTSKGRTPGITLLNRGIARWQVVLKFSKKVIYHKCFVSKEEAIKAREEVLREYKLI